MIADNYRASLLLILPLLSLLVGRLIFDFNGLYGQDAHRYFQYVGELGQYLTDGVLPGEFHWPVLYPLAGLMLQKVMGISGAWSLQLISAFSLGVAGVFLYHILKRKQDDRAFWYVLVFFMLCPQLLVASVLCMSDVFSMMWMVLAWYFYLQYRQNGKVISALALAVGAALAAISRYPTLLLVAWPLLWVFFDMFKTKQWMALLMPLVFFTFCLPELLLHTPWQSVSGSYQLQHWSAANWFQNSFTTNDGVQHYRFINLVYITYPFWHPAYFVCGIGIAMFAFFRFSPKRVDMALVATIVLYLLFLAGIEFQNRRFFIPVFPLILLMVYQIGFKNLLATLSKKLLAIGVMLLLVFQAGLAAYYLKPLLEMNHFERQLVEDLRPYEGNRLYVFYWDLALKSYEADFEYQNLWSEEVKGVERGDFILFNPEELEEQWSGSPVMVNWNYIRQNYKLEVKKSWPNGWKLYEAR